MLFLSVALVTSVSGSHSRWVQARSTFPRGFVDSSGDRPGFPAIKDWGSEVQRDMGRTLMDDTKSVVNDN